MTMARRNPRVLFPTTGEWPRPCRLILAFPDGREHSVPLSFYPTLARASRAARSRWRPIGRGIGFHRPDLDFDLSVRGILEGLRERTRSAPARRRKAG